MWKHIKGGCKMNYKYWQKQEIKTDYFMLLVVIISYIIFTTLYFLLKTNIKYLFLSCNIFSFIIMKVAIKSIINYKKARKIIKNNNTRVNMKVFANRRRKIKTVV